MCFHAKWVHPFYPDRTRPDRFFLESGEEVFVDAMVLEEADRYGNDGQVQVVELCDEGNKFCFVAAMPKSGDLTSYVDVNEQRTEAEAATEVVFNADGRGPPPAHEDVDSIIPSCSSSGTSITTRSSSWDAT